MKTILGILYVTRGDCKWWSDLVQVGKGNDQLHLLPIYNRTHYRKDLHYFRNSRNRHVAVYLLRNSTKNTFVFLRSIITKS